MIILHKTCVWCENAKVVITVISCLITFRVLLRWHAWQSCPSVFVRSLVFICASGHFAVTVANLPGIAAARLPPATAAQCGSYANPRLLSGASPRIRAPDWLLGLSLTLGRLIAASAAGFAMWNINLTQFNANLRRIKRALMEAAASHDIGNDKYRILWERFVIFTTSSVKLNPENKTGCRLAVLSK